LRWEDLVTLSVLIFVFGLVIFTIIAYINESFAFGVEFLSGVDGVSNVTWGLNETYPDGYYNNSYPILDEQEHEEESADWDKNGWTKLK
jgi:hypothetical protein